MKTLLSIILITLTIIAFGQTAIVTPGTQSYNVTITNITTNSFKINWTSGSGAYDLVIVKPAANAVSAPINANGPSYSNSAVYGSGTNIGNANFVVYKGTANTITVSNLSPNFNYEAIVYSYNYGCTQYVLGTCVQPNAYLFKTTYSSSNSESHYTLATEPSVAPTIVSVGTPGPTTATLTVTGSSSFNLINVYNQSTSNYNAPLDGTYYSASATFGSGAQIGGAGTNNFAVYNSSANGTVNLTNLTPATSYWGIVYSYNGSYGSSINTSYNYNTSNYDYVSFSTYNTPPTINTLTNYTLCQDAPQTVVLLSGIGDGSAAETQTVSISASSNNTALIPNPTISYTHPSSSGSLTFKPNAGQSGTAIITVTAYDGGPNNSQTIKTFTVNVLGIPANAGSITTATTTICQVKNGVVFTVPPIANATTYNWSLPPGATVTAGANTNSITVSFSTALASTNIKVYGSNANGCGNGAYSPSLLVNFDKVPTTSVAGSNQQICNNLTALSANSPSIGDGSWTYCSSGLGNLSSTNTPNTNLSVVNNQTVTAVWTITNGACPASSSTVTVANIFGSPSCTPYADFVANNNEICVNTVVTFSNTSVAAVGANTYTWNFGAGATPATSTSTAAAITVTYSSVGAKNVSLTMNSGAGALTMVKNAYINVITLPNAPSLVTGNTTVCQGKTAEPYFINTVTNATGYNWTFPSGVFQNTGSNTNVISANFSTTASSGNVGVSASNSCGTSSVTTIAITVNPLPSQASTITGSTTVCQGVNNLVYIANNLNNGLSFTWSTPNGCNIVSGLNTRTITVNYDNSATSGLITVFGTNGCGDGATKNKPIAVNPLPDAAGSITGSTSNNVCPLSTNINYSISPVSNATGYTWIYPSGYSVAGGNNTNSIFLDASLNASNGGIKVVATNACGAGDTSSVLNVNIAGLPTQQICVVTVDSLSTSNEIFWQKNGVSNVDSFRVYRKQSFLVDTLIGTVGYNDLSRIVDVTANPNVTSFTYKIAAVDLCGNEGPKSLEHESIHLVSIYSPSPQKMDLIWNPYLGATVNNYRVLRDTNNSGNWVVLINNLAPNASSYTDYGIPAGALSVQYRVDVIWLNSCDPTAKVAQSIVNTTKSNTKDYVISIPTNINSQNELLNSISLYPNPTKDIFDIEFKAGIESFDVEIYNQLGSVLKSEHLTYTDKATLNISEFSTGVYFVVIKTKMGSITKRITKL
jgi:hypothetical protein